MYVKRSKAIKAYWAKAVEDVFAHPEKTIKAVAQKWHLDAHNLGSHIRYHYKERWVRYTKEKYGAGYATKTVPREKYEKAAAYIKEHPEDTLGMVAYRFEICSSTPMTKYITRHYPDLLPWRREWNKAHKAKKCVRNEVRDAATLDAERAKAKERHARLQEKRRAWHLKELDAPATTFAERIESMEKRLNAIRDGLGDNITLGDTPLLKMDYWGYDVTEWRRKQHTLDVIKRRMEEVKRQRAKQ